MYLIHIFYHQLTLSNCFPCPLLPIWPSSLSGWRDLQSIDFQPVMKTNQAPLYSSLTLVYRFLYANCLLHWPVKHP